MRGNKGQVGGVLAVTIGIVLVIGVSLPISQTVIDQNNLTGLTATIVGFVPVFLGIGAMVLATRVFAGWTSGCLLFWDALIFCFISFWAILTFLEALRYSRFPFSCFGGSEHFFCVLLLKVLFVLLVFRNNPAFSGKT